ncbi:K02A2.6-like, partial [Cordylochernes scorpioides]
MQQKHHTLLHSFQPEPLNTTSIEAPIAQSSVSCFLSDTTKPNETILLSTAIVRVRAENGSFHPCRALIDTGSQRSLITENCREKLNLPVKKSQLTVFGIGNQPIQQSASETFLQFKSHFSDRIFKISSIILDQITVDLPNFLINRDNWPHLKNTLLADPNFDKTSPIDLVIGADLAPFLYTGKLRFQNHPGPTACSSKLGWILSGNVSSSETGNNYISLCSTSQGDDNLRQFFELESVPAALPLTKEEKSCGDIYDKTFCISTDGRYSVGLPFKSVPNLGDSRQNAMKRFLALERKLHKSSNLLQQYKDFMMEYLSLNHMELIPKNERDKPSDKCYYIPHHCVLRDQSSTTKLRVVFDASCKTSNNYSLNDFLHTGPKLQHDIFNILVKFRTNPIAFTGDIEKMYRQIKVNSSDLDFQRIFWRNCPLESLLEYRLLTVTYGMSCAPYLAIRTLMQLATDKELLFPEASKILKTDFYVDDLLSGATTIEEAKVLIDDIRKILLSGGFCIRKWMSNVPEVLSEDLDWDDPLSESLCSHWRRVKIDLAMLNHIKIPRYISCKGLIHSLELHGFCDASESAYSSVVYMKSRFKSGQVQVTLIAAKTKVAPLKVTSIPRLELCAALLLSNLYDSICSSLLLQIDRVILWSDSQIVLCWIKSESKHWKPFVGNRIAEIQRLTLQSSWSYVSTKDNPADCASRGITSSELVNHSLWWNGPDWLSNSSLQDPLPITYELPKEIRHEKRKTVPIVYFTTCPIIDFIFKFSTFRKLSRVTAWLLRFIHNARHSSDKIKHTELSSNELDNSIRTLIQIIQSSEFKTEIQCCNQSKVLPSNSKLLSLNPFIDSSGILRVGGRLRKSNLQFNEKHPIILPHNHFVTELIVQQFHVEHLHSGLQLTLCAIRQKYWIPSGRILVKKLINRCMTCFKTKRQVSKQIMGYLPIHRIIPSSPFSKTGIDFAGPFITKPNVIRTKVTLKSYIELFICFSTKAIHLEIVSDLSTPAFLAAFRRFISRRGKPSDIFTDNATNFKGAKNILNNIHQLVKDSSIQSYVANEHITWHFIPPSAPNFGGIWEAGIKSLKYHLLRCLKSAVLNFEELNTLTSQIEACLNSRPLMVETRSGKMQDPAQERIMAEESAKPQPGATIGRDANSDPVVLNPNIDIPKYDGTEDPRPWIESLEEIGFLYHWADYIISRYAAMNMIGSAKTWLNLHKISFTSWENFKSRLIEDFASDANKEEMKMRLNRMKQWNEPAIRFAEDILVLCNKVDPQMEEETKINWVIGGLKKEYSFALHLYPLKNTNELLEICKKLDLFENNYQERVEKSKALYNGPRSPHPHHQEQWKNTPSFRRPYQNTSKPQAPTPRYYQNKPLPQVSAPRRSYTPNPEPKPVYPSETYNKKPNSNLFIAKLNDVTVKDVYPIPRIDEVLDTLQASKYFSAIDLESGYWQVEVDEKDKEKTAFTTAHGLYEFNVMPFGLRNAPATFDRNMENMLGHFDPNAITYIHTDASNIGLGATLVQKFGDKEKVISYLSRTLSKPEQNYSTTEKECLAVVWSMSKLRPYLYGRHFKIVTDHHALCWLKNLKDPTGRLARWALKIQEYNFEIIHKSGKKHLDADGLSRGPLPGKEWDGDYERLFLNQIIDEKDDFIENIKENLSGNKRSITQNFKEENGCLYKKNPNPEGRAWLLVVPKKRRKEVMGEYHNHMLNGHLGVARTTYRLKNKYYWPSMLKDASEFVKTCHLCQSRKGSNHLPSGLLQPIPPANNPFERIGIDFVGPLPSTKRRRKWIIVLTDYYTKYGETKAVSEATVKEVSTFLIEHIILRHGAPRFLISDRCTQFTSNLMKEVRRGNEKILKCFRCGYTNHREEKCFFKDKRCFKCQKLGHISRVCKNGNWRSDRNNCSIDKEAEATNGLFNINQVKDTSNMRSYMVKVRTSGRDMNMLIDSGTGKNIISEKTYIETWVKSERPRIEKDSTKLVQWDRQRLSILGKIKADVKVNKRSITMEFLVIEGPGPNLIGREAFDQIGIGFEWINYSDNVCQITEEFMDVFKEKLGQYRGPPIHIKIKTLGKPTFLRARTLPYAIRPKVEEALRKMEEQGILTPVEFTRFATPIVPVLKRDGSIRICGDYRSTVNNIVESGTFPVPAAADLQVNLAGGKVFSKLDLKDAYQQLVVDEETAELLAINTHKGLFKVNRLPFGVSCAPGIFQRRMESLIAKIPGVVIYLDDILVTGKDEMEHDLRLREVLKSIQRMGLTLKKEKCEFKKSSLIFLGCRIDAEGIHPTEEKCEAIKNFPKPENKKELQSFLGLLNFYSKFLKDRTTVLEPLHRLLNKRNFWKWKEVEDRAFREAKNLIQSDLVLTPYDATKPLVLACDASPFGVGAVLSHVEERMERPIAFASRTMSQTERRYAQIDKEALAIIFGISKFYKYLYGRDFKIITDHKPLLGIFNPNKPIPQMLSPRMMRWSLTLASYSYQIEHRPGRINANADALSRAPHERTSKETPEPVDVFLMETNEESPLEAKEVAKSTQEDSVLGIIVEWTRIGWPSHCPAEKFRPYFNRRNELSLHRECLLWGNRVVIPPVLQGRTLEQLHETHPGIVQMKAIARSHVWWPGMDKAIENKVERCKNCQLVRNNPKPSPVHPWTAPVKPWSRIHVDYAGPFHGRTFLIVVDSMSKWPEAIIMDHCTATATVRVLRSLFAVHGLPDQVVSDNGRMFVGHEFQEFLRMNGVRHITSAPYHPQTNGQAERVVQTLKQLIRKNGWENISVTLPRALFAMRTTPHGTTGLTPAELLMGRRLTTRMNRLHPKESEDSENGKEHFQNRFKSQENVYARKFNGKGKWEPGKIKTVLGPRNYEVIMENGVTAKRHQDQLMRRVKEEVAEDVEKKEECNTERRREQMNDPNESQERLEETPGPSRPIRNRRLPEYLKDCVTNW